MPFLFAKKAISCATPFGSAILALIMVAALGACSSAPSLGDAMRAQGVELAAIGDQWTEGDALIDEGEDQIEDGKTMIAEGRELIDDGEDLVDEGEVNIREGQDLRRTAEVTYNNKTGKELPTP